MQLNPYLKFNDDKCREAMAFYKESLGGGGELTFQTVGESPMAKEMPEENGDKIMHAVLKVNGVEIYGSDMMRDKAIVGDSVGLSLNFENEEEIRSVFSKLSEGGEVFMPLEKQFWGALFGVVTDKYGVEWMLNYQIDAPAM
jgi:PhnB protein